jgi:NADH-quinone oxidoreductase subunit M
MMNERRHTRMIADYGGLFRRMPLFGGIFVLVALSSIGLPGLNGFVGEFLILLGTFRVQPIYGIVAVTGIIWAAWYMLGMLRRVLFGPLIHRENAGLSDLTWNERTVLIPILILIVWIGVYPTPFLRRMEASVERVIAQVERQQMVQSGGFMAQGRWAMNPELSTMNREASSMNPDQSTMNRKPSTVNRTKR